MRLCSRPIRLPGISQVFPLCVLCDPLRDGDAHDKTSGSIKRPAAHGDPLLPALQSAGQEGGHLGAGDLVGGTEEQQRIGIGPR